MCIRMQDLVYLLLGLLVHPLLLRAVPKHRYNVLHGRKLVVAFSLGSQSYLITVVLDLRLMPESNLDLN